MPWASFVGGPKKAFKLGFYAVFYMRIMCWVAVSHTSAHNQTATVAPFRAWRGLQRAVAKGPTAIVHSGTLQKTIAVSEDGG
jgi:hypothetical protein